MFLKIRKTKYQKVLDMLDEEIDFARSMFNRCTKKKYDHINDPEIRDGLIMANVGNMKKYLEQWGALETLKRRIDNEIGM